MGATCFVQPLDLVKNRMQLSGEGGKAREYPTSFHAIRGIMAKEGIVAMYSGLSAGLLRQATYTTTRLGRPLHKYNVVCHYSTLLHSVFTTLFLFT